MASKKNRSRKSLAVALAIVGVAGLSMASAAQLNVTSDTVAAGVSVVSACDSTVAVAYGTGYSAGTYKVTSVTVSGVDATACNGRTLDFTLLDSGNVSLGTGTASIVTGTTSYQVTGLTASAAAVVGIAVVIH